MPQLSVPLNIMHGVVPTDYEALGQDSGVATFADSAGAFPSFWSTVSVKKLPVNSQGIRKTVIGMKAYPNVRTAPDPTVPVLFASATITVNIPDGLDAAVAEKLREIITNAFNATDNPDFCSVATGAVNYF